MESTAKVTVKRVGSGGTYRVSGGIGRSAITGRFVTAATAARRPRTTALDGKGTSTSKRN